MWVLLLCFYGTGVNTNVPAYFNTLPPSYWSTEADCKEVAAAYKEMIYATSNDRINYRCKKISEIPNAANRR